MIINPNQKQDFDLIEKNVKLLSSIKYRNIYHINTNLSSLGNFHRKLRVTFPNQIPMLFSSCNKKIQPSQF